MSPPTPNPRRRGALALLCGTFFVVILSANIVVVALPSIEEALSFSEQGLQRVISAYALTFAGLLLLGGRAADLLGRPEGLEYVAFGPRHEGDAETFPADGFRPRWV